MHTLIEFTYNLSSTRGLVKVASIDAILRASVLEQSHAEELDFPSSVYTCTAFRVGPLS